MTRISVYLLVVAVLASVSCTNRQSREVKIPNQVAAEQSKTISRTDSEIIAEYNIRKPVRQTISLSENYDYWFDPDGVLGQLVDDHDILQITQHYQKGNVPYFKASPVLTAAQRHDYELLDALLELGYEKTAIGDDPNPSQYDLVTLAAQNDDEELFRYYSEKISPDVMASVDNVRSVIRQCVENDAFKILLFVTDRAKMFSEFAFMPEVGSFVDKPPENKYDNWTYGTSNWKRSLMEEVAAYGSMRINELVLNKYHPKDELFYDYVVRSDLDMTDPERWQSKFPPEHRYYGSVMTLMDIVENRDDAAIIDLYVNQGYRSLKAKAEQGSEAIDDFKYDDAVGGYVIDRQTDATYCMINRAGEMVIVD